MTKELKCNCKSTFQDYLYGNNIRLFNAIGKDGKDGYRCTVCGKEVKQNDSSKKK